MNQICLCGSGPGYLHPEDCPFPLFYSGDLERVAEWIARREEIRRDKKGGQND